MGHPFDIAGRDFMITFFLNGPCHVSQCFKQSEKYPWFRKEVIKMAKDVKMRLHDYFLIHGLQYQTKRSVNFFYNFLVRYRVIKNCKPQPIANKNYQKNLQQRCGDVLRKTSTDSICKLYPIA